MKRPEIENLNHQQNGHNLNVFQKADAIIEFHKLIKYIEHLESEVQKDLIASVLGRSEQFICPICGLDGFEDQADLDIHLEDCEDIDY
jgi:hypothetical protein